MLRVTLLSLAMISGGAAMLGLAGATPAQPGPTMLDDENPNSIPVGSVAPEFSVKTLDGKEDVKLSDYKGKYLLLDFWASWCPPCLKEVPNVKAVWDTHGKDSRFALVSLSLDAKPEDATKFTQDHQMTWRQGYLPGALQGNSKVLSAYGIESIPSIWLISPDGKVLAKDLMGPDIEKAVKDALKK